MHRLATATFFACLLSAVAARGIAAQEGTLLAPRAKGNDLTVSRNADGSWAIATTGHDPYFFTDGAPDAFDPARHQYLAFEYQVSAPVHGVQVMLFSKGKQPEAVDGASLQPGSDWAAYSVDLKPAFSRLPKGPLAVRIDFGTEAGKTIQIRSLRLRPPDDVERQAALALEQKAAEEARRARTILEYVSKAMPEQVGSVSVDEKSVHVEGKLSGAAQDVFLAEAPAELNIVDATGYPFLAPIKPDAAGQFSVTFDRYRDAKGVKHDRLLSRWAIVRKIGGKFELRSHARWPDTVVSKSQPPELKPRTKKGLGGFSAGRFPISDLDDLGISAATVNLQMTGLFRAEPGPNRTAFAYGGQTWYAEDRAFAALDRTLLAAAERRIVVSAIVLIGKATNAPDKSWGKLVAHPDADPAGIFAMPNVTDEEGVLAYAAGLDFLARRYSGSPGESAHGRIHHWIMHNEVDAGWTWTNAGDKTLMEYVDLYHRSCRIAQLIARQYDPHARAMVSLTHHWGKPGGPRYYAGRDVLDTFAAFSKAEGDFDWGIAYHPYPQDLFEPRTWLDKDATASFDTSMITFKNIEVLDAYLRQPRMTFQGKRLRMVHLSEQGPNSRYYSEKALTDQAAAMAYVWNKIRDLPSIEAFEYHNWVDNRGEGGLRIGLRRFPDDKDDPLGRKPVWYVYRSLGTPDEEAVTAFAKPIIGIESWGAVRSAAPISP